MRYIINADDFGRTKTVNDAIMFGFVNGYLSRTTAMVNMPFFDEAVKISEEHGFKDKVGLHINITSGVPLTDDIKNYDLFCDEKGIFNGKLFDKKYMFSRLKKGERNALVKEIDAQIEKFFASGFTLLHADSHGHVHTFEAVSKIILKELKKYGFKSVRISRNIKVKGAKKAYKKLKNIKFMRFNRKNGSHCDYFDSYKVVEQNYDWLNREEGICEIMLHPNSYEGQGMQIGEGYRYHKLKREILEEKI